MNDDWLRKAVTERVGKSCRVSLYCSRLDGAAAYRFGSRVMPAASLIKVPIMVCAFRQEKMGRLRFGESCAVYGNVEGGSFFYMTEGTAVTIETLIAHMIVESDNTCTNMLIDKLGFDAVNEEIRRQGMTDTVLRRKMMDFDAAAAGRENVTTAEDMGELFRRLAAGTCVDAGRDAAMRRILAQQEDNCILPAQIPHTVPVEHKTGQLDGIYHDCGIVWKDGAPYVCAVMADGIEKEPEAVYGLAYLARDIYDHM